MKLFAHGGLQRDCMAIARRLVAQGHEVQIVCALAITPPADLDVVVLPNRAGTNHGIKVRFSRALHRYVTGAFDLVVGFDALEGLDVLYCANPPVRMRSILDRLNPRNRAMLRLERACFDPRSRTQLLLLSDVQRSDYDRRWALSPARVTMIPPTIERCRVVLKEERSVLRTRLREELGLADDTPVWLFVGSFPHTKGLDRVIAAMPKFPAAHLLCVGPEGGKLPPFRAQADELGLGSRVSWLGARDDVTALMVASDIFVHPSRLDVTGTVILEAIVHGLPAIATDTCGHAVHITASDAGRVLGSPFQMPALVAALVEADGATREAWRHHAETYAQTMDLFSGLDVAAETIVRVGQKSAQ